jgi:hypothetical protein
MLILLDEGVSGERRAAVRRRLDNLGIVQLAWGSGYLAVVDHEAQALVRQWPGVRVVGGVRLDLRRPVSRSTGSAEQEKADPRRGDASA